MDHRRSVRARTLCDTAFSAGRSEGEAVLTNLSSGGALFESDAICPPVDSDIRMTVFVTPQRTVDLVGVVLRHTGSGFAVRLKSQSEQVRLLLEELGQDEAD